MYTIGKRETPDKSRILESGLYKRILPIEQLNVVPITISVHSDYDFILYRDICGDFCVTRRIWVEEGGTFVLDSDINTNYLHPRRMSGFPTSKVAPPPHSIAGFAGGGQFVLQFVWGELW